MPKFNKERLRREDAVVSIELTDDERSVDVRDPSLQKLEASDVWPCDDRNKRGCARGNARFMSVCFFVPPSCFFVDLYLCEVVDFRSQRQRDVERVLEEGGQGCHRSARGA